MSNSLWIFNLYSSEDAVKNTIIPENEGSIFEIKGITFHKKKNINPLLSL